MRKETLVLLSIVVTLNAAQTTINSFEAQADLGILGSVSTVYDEYVQLWADVTNCPSSPCSCHVINNQNSETSYPMVFEPNRPNKGMTEIRNLQPYTNYQFTLSCEGTDQTITLPVQTEVGRPSAPQSVILSLIGRRLHISWSVPLEPAGPIDHYRILIDGSVQADRLPNDRFTYEVNEDYIYGTTHTLNVLACNQNSQNRVICTEPGESQMSFCATDTDFSTTWKPSSSAKKWAASPLILFVLLVMQYSFSKIK